MTRPEDASAAETNYLLHSPENARRLLDSIESARAGRVAEHELLAD